jgi:hypothetical protein
MKDQLPPGHDDLAEHDSRMSVRDARNAGAVPTEGAEPMDRHHIFPQSERKWFAERGVDVDDFCVDLSDFDHDMIHGGNQGLASKHWREGEWRSDIMDRLDEAERRLKRNLGPQAKLSRETILEIGHEQMTKFDIADRPFVHYTRTPRP